MPNPERSTLHIESLNGSCLIFYFYEKLLSFPLSSFPLSLSVYSSLPSKKQLISWYYVPDTISMCQRRINDQDKVYSWSTSSSGGETHTKYREFRTVTTAGYRGTERCCFLGLGRKVFTLTLKPEWLEEGSLRNSTEICSRTEGTESRMWCVWGMERRSKYQEHSGQGKNGKRWDWRGM